MIHPTAIVESGAHLGVGVRIGPYAYVSARVRLGDGCILGPHAVVHDYTTLGARCRVHSGAVLGDLPQDFAFQEAESFVIAGDDCVFREGVTVHRGTQPGSVTRLGNHVYMMANSHVAHNCEVGDHVIMANGTLLAGHVTVGERCVFGGTAAVHQFCHVGRLAMVGSTGIITKDLPPFCMSEPVANSHVVGLNTIGLRRAGFTVEQRALIKKAFGILYRSGLNTAQARRALLADTANPFAVEMGEFVAAAKRGMCRPSFRIRGVTAHD